MYAESCNSWDSTRPEQERQIGGTESSLKINPRLDREGVFQVSEEMNV